MVLGLALVELAFTDRRIASTGIMPAAPFFLVGASLPAIVSFARPELAGKLLVAGLGATSALVPWGGGGVFHPVLFLGLTWIHFATFLAGVRWGFVGAAIFLADLVLLHLAGEAGRVAVVEPPVSALICCAAAMAVLEESFVASPLAVAHRYVEKARADLLERRGLEEKLVAMNEGLEAEVQARCESLRRARGVLNEAIDEISGEFRRAIRSMRSEAEVLALGADGDTEADWAARGLALSCHRMERIHESFLRFWRIGGGELSVQPVSGRAHESLVMDAWAEVRAQHPGRDFTFSLEALPDAKADPDLLRQVWQNLLSNAAKFTEGRSPAWIRVACSGPWFLVEDNGRGFDSSISGDPFDPFRGGDPRDENSPGGIGLATVRRIVERHGGSVQAEPLMGKGARFLFRLDREMDLASAPLGSVAKDLGTG